MTRHQAHRPTHKARLARALLFLAPRATTPQPRQDNNRRHNNIRRQPAIDNNNCRIG
jgi:hypothetical protein